MQALDRIRAPKPRRGFPGALVPVVLLALAGLAAGVAAKWLDVMSIDGTIRWQAFLGRLDLRNVFSRPAAWAVLALPIALFSRGPLRAALHVLAFFAGMMAGYYIYTVAEAGFFPQQQIVIWSAITLATPLAGAAAWYARGRGWPAALMGGVILAFFLTQAFAWGMWYLDIANPAEVVCLVLAAMMLLRFRWEYAASLGAAVVLAPALNLLLEILPGLIL